jgi:hypothetical protein
LNNSGEHSGDWGGGAQAALATNPIVTVLEAKYAVV